MKSIQYRARLCLRPDQKIETGECAVDECIGDGTSSGRRWCCGRLGVEERTLVGPQSEIMAGQEKLNAVGELVRKRDLGDGRVYRDLQLRLIHLLQCRGDDPVAFLVRIDQQGVVDAVGRDSHILQNRLSTAGRSAAAVQRSEVGVVRGGHVSRRAETGCAGGWGPSG